VVYAQTATDDTLSNQQYINNVHGFSLYPPDGWTKEEDTDEGWLVTFTGQSVDSTIYLLVGVEDTSLSISEYTSTVKTHLSQNTNFTLLSQSSQIVGGYACVELIFTETISGFDAKEKGLIFVQNGEGYIFLFEASLSDFDSYLPIFEKSLQTLTFNGPSISPAPTDNYTSEPTKTPSLSTATITNIVLVLTAIIVGGIAGGVLLAKRKKPTDTVYAPIIDKRNLPPPPPTQPVDKAPAIPCLYCGTDNVSTAKCCVKCGKRLEG
jgi:hypothetical protein